jgi:hypothetical protein
MEISTTTTKSKSIKKEKEKKRKESFPSVYVLIMSFFSLHLQQKLLFW